MAEPHRSKKTETMKIPHTAPRSGKGAQRVEHLLVKDERHALATTKDPLRFDNKDCRVVDFDGDTIAPVRAYLAAGVSGAFSAKTPSSPSGSQA